MDSVLLMKNVIHITMVILPLILAFGNYNYIIDLPLSYFTATCWMCTDMCVYSNYVSFHRSLLVHLFLSSYTVRIFSVLTLLGKNDDI